MEHRRGHLGFAFVSVGAVAVCLSCSSSETSGAGTSAGVPDGSGGAASTVSTTGMVATTGDVGMTAATATTGATNTTGVESTSATTGGVVTTGATTGSSGTTGTTGAEGAGGGVATDGNGTTGVEGSGGTSGAAATNTSAAGTGGTAGSSDTDAAPSAGCDQPAGLSSGRASIDVGGKMREYILRVPDDYDPSHPYKLIFGWHPWGGSAEQTANMGYFGLESVSDDQAILVAPEGQDFQDGGLGWGNANGEDIDFLHAMLDRFGSELCIDQNRIFSTGFSFGAMFSFTLACSQSSMMRAIAPQAGNATTSGPCEDGTRSVATMAFIGTDDTLLSGHRQAVQIMVERNGCSTEPVTLESSWCDGLSSMYEPCTCVEYPDCKAGYPVISCEYKAGHQFAPNAGETLWNFFSQF